MNIKSLMTSLLIVIFFGCEEDKLVAITDNPVTAELFVVYDGPTNITTGTAQFWDAKRTKRVIFHGAAKLSFEFQPMQYRSTDYSYTKEILGFRSPATFTITDVNNQTFTNAISLNSIELPLQYIDTTPDTIDSSQPLTLRWMKRDGAQVLLVTTGVPLDTGETVTLRIETNETPTETATIRQETIGSNSVTVTVADFNELTRRGNVTLSLERTKVLDRLPDPLGGGTGTITAQYITPARNVYLK